MVKISPIQLKVLAELKWQARLSAEDIAANLKLRPHSVRYALRYLKDALGFHPLCWTDPYALGQIPYRVFFSLHGATPARQQALIDELTQLEQVHWLASLIGRYQFGVGFRAQSLLDLLSLFERLDKKFGNLIVSKSVGSLAQLIHFYPWMAYDTSRPRPISEYKASTPPLSLDEIDRRILSELRGNPLVPLSQLARLCRLPASTLSYRFDRLQTEGAILGFAVAYDVRRINRESFVISIATGGLGAECYGRIFSFARQSPQTTWLARSSGTWDMELGVTVESIQDIHQIIQSLRIAAGTTSLDIDVHTVATEHKG